MPVGRRTAHARVHTDLYRSARVLQVLGHPSTLFLPCRTPEPAPQRSAGPPVGRAQKGKAARAVRFAAPGCQRQAAH
jgi:hypothetical protein